MPKMPRTACTVVNTTGERSPSTSRNLADQIAAHAEAVAIGTAAATGTAAVGTATTTGKTEAATAGASVSATTAASATTTGVIAATRASVITTGAADTENGSDVPLSLSLPQRPHTAAALPAALTSTCFFPSPPTSALSLHPSLPPALSLLTPPYPHSLTYPLSVEPLTYPLSPPSQSAVVTPRRSQCELHRNLICAASC
mmetsp:Transcript_45316/g.98599  ORF Transcript_45316/g.98599 Transcript_45316/m.98599 type:complete len:200 (-) Transcript_45316:101-700(-)